MSNDKNIISFPDPVERLMEKAENLIVKEKFKDAYEILEKIETTEENIIEVEFMRILCLADFGRVEEAIEKCQRILEVVFVEEVVFIYTSLLRAIGREDEAAAVMMEYEEMDEDELEELQQYIDTVSDEIDMSVEDFKMLFADPDSLDEQLFILKVLENKDITPYFPQMKNILKAKKPGYMLKSSIIQLLDFHDVDKKVVVYKAGKQVSIQPNDIPEELFHWYEEIEEEISRCIEHINPSLYQLSMELWNQLRVFLFPVQFDEFSSKVWAMAIITYTDLYNEEGISETKQIEKFKQEDEYEISEVMEIIEDAMENSGMM